MPVYPCNHDVVRVMLGMAGQWVIEGMSGRIVCLRMEVLPVVLSSLGIAPSADSLLPNIALWGQALAPRMG